MGVTNWLLSRTGKERGNRGGLSLDVASFHGIFNGLSAETLRSVILEVGRRSPVLRILETAHATSRNLARLGSTSKEVTWAAFVSLNGNVWFKKRVDGGAPGALKPH
jgi:hypothetical protein